MAVTEPAATWLKNDHPAEVADLSTGNSSWYADYGNLGAWKKGRPPTLVREGCPGLISRNGTS